MVGLTTLYFLVSRLVAVSRSSQDAVTIEVVKRLVVLGVTCDLGLGHPEGASLAAAHRTVLPAACGTQRLAART